MLPCLTNVLQNSEQELARRHNTVNNWPVGAVTFYIAAGKQPLERECAHRDWLVEKARQLFPVLQQHWRRNSSHTGHNGQTGESVSDVLLMSQSKRTAPHDDCRQWADNALIGTIHTTIAQLAELKILFLDRNQLIGSIPSEMARMSSLNNLQVVFDCSKSSVVNNHQFAIQSPLSKFDEWSSAANAVSQGLLSPEQHR